MTSFQYQLFYLTFFAMTFVRADIVSGKCPKVAGTKFNFSEVVYDFLEDYDPYWDTQIDLLIYGFLPSSPESKSLNVFAYDFEHVNISDYYANLNYNFAYKMNNFRVYCGRPWDLLPEDVGIEFELVDQKDEEEKFQLKPRFAIIRNDTCGPFLKQEFEHITRTNPGKYFAIWGCHQISESMYDRGLWVLGVNKNQTSSGPNRIRGEIFSDISAKQTILKVGNAHQIITEALIDMKLENQTRILENMIINVNKFTPPEKLNCSIKRYNNQCNFGTWYEILRQHGKVALFIFITVVLVVAAPIVICYYAFIRD